MAEWLSTYHRLPYPAKVVAASLRGQYLQWWRYGPETEELVARAEEREEWSSQEWAAWREERVALILDRAAKRVPYYRNMWDERRRRGDRSSWKELSNWPILEKESVRRDPGAFVADDKRSGQLYHFHTSGSTGTPLALCSSRRNLHIWYALFEGRWRRWHGVSRRDRWAILGGQLVAHPERSRPPYWVWNAGLKQLYLSTLHINSRTTRDYLRAIRKYDVVYLLGYPSAFYELAREISDQRLNPPPLKVVISNAEPILPHQRALIEQAFCCPVRDTYGVAEMVVGAGECEEGQMHVWPEVGVIEVLDEQEMAVPPAQIGSIVCTGLLNDDMPLIRYAIGDRGAMAPGGERCSCGRSLPIVHMIEGRLDDVIDTPDGRRIGRLDTVFKADLPICEAQIVQDQPNHLTVRVVPAEGYSPATETTIRQRLRERVGQMKVLISQEEKIPRGPNGKFRGVVSQISGEEE